MGARGPMPQNRAELLGHRSKDVLEGKDITKLQGGLGEYKIPEPDENWHPAARMIWDACRNSRVCQQVYQPTDWAVLWFTCDDASFFKDPDGKRSAMFGSMVYSSFASLLLTEGDRRRAKIEILNEGPKVDENKAAEDFYSNIFAD